MGPWSRPAGVWAKSSGNAEPTPDVARIVDGQRRYRISAGALRNEKDACPIPPDVQAVIRGAKEKPADQSACWRR